MKDNILIHLYFQYTISSQELSITRKIRLKYMAHPIKDFENCCKFNKAVSSNKKFSTIKDSCIQ